MRLMRPPSRLSSLYALLLAFCFRLPLIIVARRRNPGFITFQHSSKQAFGLLNARRRAAVAESAERDGSRIPKPLVQSLDLAPVIRSLSNHAGTRRGREAILGLIGEEQIAARPPPVLVPESDLSSKRRRVTNRERQSESIRETELSIARESLAPIATSAEECRNEYELVEQAMLTLQGTNGLTVPPLYGATSSPWDTDTKVDTDHDEWLKLPFEDWTLENVLQAEQILKTLVAVHEWGNQSDTLTWTPGLSELAQTISEVEFRPILDEIQDAVEIATKRSIVKSQPLVYKFQLRIERFPALTILREKEQMLQDTIGKELKSILRKLKGSPEMLEYEGRMTIYITESQANAVVGVTRGTTVNGKGCYVEPRSIVKWGDELVAVRNELYAIESDIERGLMDAIFQGASAIDRGIHTMARLDVIFGKGAFGEVLNGSVPKIQHTGRIHVQDFIYPVLFLQRSRSDQEPVPVDLLLSHETGSQALIISGPNGGGKTIALKSFGVVSLLAKLAIPIPQSQKLPRHVHPQVDYFDKLVVDVGDQQSVIEGESTLMAKLNSYSSVIESVIGNRGHLDDQLKVRESSLILLDELGGGTDPTAGGAIAQAIMEKLLESEDCRIVATTHSPRLKALSYNSTRYNCASVLLKNDPASKFKLPSYKLEYGKIGDSYALGAASRCFPPLPEDVLDRAASLMASTPNDEGTGESISYLRALTASLEEEREAATSAKAYWEKNASELQACRNAMIRLAETYSDHLNGVEHRLQDLFRELRDDESKDAMQVVGETIETLKLTKMKVKTEEEVLKERGLRKVSPDHYFKDGDSIVILTPGEYEGTTATVVPNSDLVDKDKVAVVPSIPAWGDPFFSLDKQVGEFTSAERSLIVNRAEVAIWDVSGVWDDFDNEYDPPASSVRESRQKLTSLLSSLKTSPKAPKEAKTSSASSQGKTYKSARERKAARRKRK